ncbi:MAG TPA: Uma2 family endonuclease [Tepidisphaeraceae bacterium]|nr:Uma2 family endonuclease [Tepidisphaeraceae bacterium]
MELSVEEPKRFYTVQEYLHLEATSDTKHEYRDGEIIDMSGGTLEHSLVIANVIRELGITLKGKPCRVYDSNLRVRIGPKPLYCYPDATVICGEPVVDPNEAKRLTALNPRLVVEVISPRTAHADRGPKFTSYREIDGFEEYVLVSVDRPLIEVYYRQPDGTWLFSPVAGRDGSVRLRSVGVTLNLAEAYAGVEFPPDPDNLYAADAQANPT